MTLDKLLVILGPTATGKTDLGIYLAKKFNGELVSCDSRQVYIGMDVGTGKITNPKSQISKGKGFWEVDGVKIWMYDVVSPKIQYTVADYVKDANRVINGILEKRELPIIVGGAGLYLKALLEGLSNLAIPVDRNLRKKLQKISLKKLQKKLQEVDCAKWQSMNQPDRQNPRRLVRAIELVLNKKLNIKNKKYILKIKNFDVLKLGLNAPRDILYKKVDERVIDRIKQGMVDEAKNLHKKGLSLKRMRQLGLEYGVLADYLDGKIGGIQGDQGLIKVMQNKIHGYIRRQLIWFKKETNAVWFDITDEDYTAKVEDLVTKWYDSVDVTTKN